MVARGIILLLALVGITGLVAFNFGSGKLKHPNFRSCQLMNPFESAKKIATSLYATQENESNFDSSQFEEWEKEEIEAQREEILRRIDEAKDSGDEDLDDVPEYMLRMISQFEDPEELGKLTPESKLPTIAIIGRPNTGKSTIVNKLTSSYKSGAIVHDSPGITRDRTYRTGSWCDFNFQVVDTGGIIFDDTDDIFAEKITEQALIALREASVGILVCDGKEGVTPLDVSIAEWLRKNNNVPIYLAINKCESVTQGLIQAQDFWELGIGNPYPVSGIHGSGLGELLDEVTKHMSKVTNVQKENCTNIAFIGRPNVGKSSLFNRMYGEERAIVSDVAGTTRDTVDALIEKKGKQFRIIDTAGIRKKGKIGYGPEFFMVNRAFKAIRRAEVVVLMLDATTGIVEQDRILADKISAEGRSCVIALNKWDAVAKKDDKTYLKAVDNIRSNLPVLRWAEVVLISALTGQRTDKLFEAVERASSQFARRVPTALLNEVVNEATMWMAPPSIGPRSGKIYYSMQVSTAPPTIVLFVNDPGLFTDNYQRFLERKLRDALKFEGAPLKMIWRGKSLRDVSRAAVRGDSEVGKIVGGAVAPRRAAGTTGSYTGNNGMGLSPGSDMRR